MLDLPTVEAIQSSGLSSLKKWRTGLISATTVGGIDRTENFFIDFLKDTSRGKLRDVIDHECGRSTELMADALGIHGFVSWLINVADDPGVGGA